MNKMCYIYIQGINEETISIICFFVVENFVPKTKKKKTDHTIYFALCSAAPCPQSEHTALRIGIER